MTSPAPITHELTWAEMEAAIFQFTADMIAFREYHTGQHEPDRDDEAAQATGDRVAERAADIAARLDYETDFDLDGDYDPGPEYDDPAYDEPDAEADTDRDLDL